MATSAFVQCDVGVYLWIGISSNPLWMHSSLFFYLVECLITIDSVAVELISVSFLTSAETPLLWFYQLPPELHCPYSQMGKLGLHPDCIVTQNLLTFIVTTAFQSLWVMYQSRLKIVEQSLCQVSGTPISSGFCEVSYALSIIFLCWNQLLRSRKKPIYSLFPQGIFFHLFSVRGGKHLMVRSLIKHYEDTNSICLIIYPVVYTVYTILFPLFTENILINSSKCFLGEHQESYHWHAITSYSLELINIESWGEGLYEMKAIMEVKVIIGVKASDERWCK